MVQVNIHIILEAFVPYFTYVRSLLFSEEPKYDLVKKIFREALVKMDEQDKPLDWMTDD